MTTRQIEIQFRLLEKRRKYDLIEDEKERERKQKALTKLANSFWIVYPDWMKDARKISVGIENRKQAKKRTNKYLLGMFESYDELYFVTLTFNEDTMQNTTEQTRRKYVSRYLNENCRDYYANIDYGAENGREHYHAVVCDRLDLEKWHKYGGIYVTKIRKSKRDVRKVATYIRKLTNHANKITTGRAFHKRGTKEIDELPF